MVFLRILFISICLFISTALTAQVRVRIFPDVDPDIAVFSVRTGTYKVESFTDSAVTVVPGEPLLIAKFDGRIVIKRKDQNTIVCDSLKFSGTTGSDAFYFRPGDASNVRQSYSGDLECRSDIGTILYINITDAEKYISGVVKAEGGYCRNIEYLKTQAIIARTYLLRNFNRHSGDGYNMCDDIHCQAFNGLSDDSLIDRAAKETHGLVLLTADSTLIVSAFHSNCGGQTSSSADVWLSSLPYLKSIKDPYCVNSRNANWQKTLSFNEWVAYLMRSGYRGNPVNRSSFNFLQSQRIADYQAGSFEMSLNTIRTDLNLRSTFFSVTVKGDSVIIKGRGYGHGVGLCQEGAMAMSEKGFKYNEIINFYYSGVIISDAKNAVILP